MEALGACLACLGKRQYICATPLPKHRHVTPKTSSASATSGMRNIPLGNRNVNSDLLGGAYEYRSARDQWQTEGRAFRKQMDALVETLDGR